jgi:hypothetical protein
VTIAAPGDVPSRLLAWLIRKAGHDGFRERSSADEAVRAAEQAQQEILTAFSSVRGRAERKSDRDEVRHKPPCALDDDPRPASKRSRCLRALARRDSGATQNRPRAGKPVRQNEDGVGVWMPVPYSAKCFVRGILLGPREGHPIGHVAQGNPDDYGRCRNAQELEAE